MKWILRIILLSLFILLVYLLVNAFNFRSKQILPVPLELKELRAGAWSNLSKAMVLPGNPIISSSDSLAYRNLDTLVFQSFPLIDSFLERKVVNQFSSIYHWKGKNPELNPIFLLAQKDIGVQEPDTILVAEQNSRKKAPKPSDERIRLFAIMEAVEMLIEEGYQPDRGIYLGLNHDAETGGYNGSVACANWLESQNIAFEFILDKGSGISKGIEGLTTSSLAFIGVGEKGCAIYDLNVESNKREALLAPGGNSASSEMISALQSLANHTFPANPEIVLKDFMDYLGSESDFWFKLKVTNKGLFLNRLINQFSKQARFNSMLRTTTECVDISIEQKEAQSSHRARAKVVAGILPGETIESTIAQIKETINNPKVEVSISQEMTSTEAPSVSSTSSFGFNVIQKTMRNLYPDVATTPIIVSEINDSRYFSHLSKDTYRFSPIPTDQELQVIWANKEDAINTYIRSVNFYYQLLSNSTR